MLFYDSVADIGVLQPGFGGRAFGGCAATRHGAAVILV